MEYVPGQQLSSACSGCLAPTAHQGKLLTQSYHDLFGLTSIDHLQSEMSTHSRVVLQNYKIALNQSCI